MFPPKDRLTICFAHAAYQLQERFLRRQMTINSFEVRTLDEFERRIGEADVRRRFSQTALISGRMGGFLARVALPKSGNLFLRSSVMDFLWFFLGSSCLGLASRETACRASSSRQQQTRGQE